MPQTAKVYEIFIASPSDTKEERETIVEIIDLWNAVHYLEKGIIAHPIRWETHYRPALEDRPQSILNKILLERADILIGVFRQKVGASTGVYDSGIIEEIEEFRKLGRPVLLYFFDVPPMDDTDTMTWIDRLMARKEYRSKKDAYINRLAEYNQLQRVRDRYIQLGLISLYKSLSEFKELVERHLFMNLNSLTIP